MAPTLQGQNNIYIILFIYYYYILYIYKGKESSEDKYLQIEEISSNRNWYLVIENLKQWFHSFTGLVISLLCHTLHLYL